MLPMLHLLFFLILFLLTLQSLDVNCIRTQEENREREGEGETLIFFLFLLPCILSHLWKTPVVIVKLACVLVFAGPPIDQPQGITMTSINVYLFRVAS